MISTCPDSSQYRETVVKLCQETDPEGKTTTEKLAITRKFREDQYEKLLDAVYFRRGWTPNGIPTLKRLKEIGMDLPEVLEVIKPLQ